MVWLIPWVILGATVALFTLAVWHLLETASDLYIVRSRKAKTPVIRQAVGATSLAGLRLVGSVFWFIIGVLVLLSPTPPRQAGRYLLGILIVMEIAKLSTERITRYRISNSIEDERTLLELEALRVEHKLEQKAEALLVRVEQKAEDLANRVDQKHDEVMAAIAENTQISAAAHEVSNHVNEKLEKLGITQNQLVAQQHDDHESDKKEATETKPHVETVKEG